MAPEQIAGNEVTPRSDIYALGLVLYELFTGQRALDAANLAELIAKREQAAITPPTALVRDLDPSIERVIFRCLEADPTQRPGPRSRWPRHCPAAIRSRPRSRPAKRRHPRWSPPPVTPRRSRPRVVVAHLAWIVALARSLSSRCISAC